MNRRRFLTSLPPALSTVATMSTLTLLAQLTHIAPARAGQPLVTNRHTPRIVVLDWGLTETLLAMGITPVGAAEVAAYQATVVTPPLPPTVSDVGLRLAPSLEWLQALAPDLILINSSQMSQREVLERIAPVHVFAVYSDTGEPYRHAQEITYTLGQLCGQVDAATALIATTENTLAACRQRLQNFAQVHALRARPLYIAQFFDARHLGLYGQHSLCQEVMLQLGLTNAWQGATDYWGIGLCGLDTLAANADATLLYFEPLPPSASRMMQGNRLWQALPAPQAGRVAALAPFWGFGMLPSAERFARVLTEHLCSSNIGWRHA